MSKGDDEIDYMLIAIFLEEHYEDFYENYVQNAQVANKIIEALRKKANE